jgi:hypothetical protein
MADRNDVSQLIARIVRETKIADARERAELQRELESHFAEVESSDEAMAHAIERFGCPASIGSRLAEAHRRGPFVTRALRVGFALTTSSFVALGLQLLACLRIDTRGATLALGSGFFRALIFSAMLIVVLITAWELDIEAFCARIERHPARMLWIVIGLATAMMAFHAVENSMMPPPGLALTASGIDVVIWTCTIAILARTDRFFAGAFTQPTLRG